jgi:paraquat-inducible protein A
MGIESPAVPVACKVCGEVHALAEVPAGMAAKCVRCGSTIEKRTADSLHVTAACALAALLLYVPANTLPILRIELYGASSDNTAWEGAMRLLKDGDYIIACIVFMASIFVPLLKLLGLFYLVVSTKFRFKRGKKLRTWVYQFIDLIGRWAMLDVFVVAVLVSAVKLNGLATVMPGRGLLAFGGVVVFTILASASFDPQLIWEKEETAK